MAEQRNAALQEITGVLAAGIVHDVGEQVARHAATEHVPAIQRQLETAAHNGGAHAAATIVSAPHGILTRDEQDRLRAERTSLDDNARYFARRYARERSAELVGMRYDANGRLVENPDAKWAISDTTRDVVRDIVGRAVAGRWTAATLADRLQQTGAFSPARAMMIARTEINRALNAGTMEAARKATETGRKFQKEWATGPDPCEICIENEEEGPIDLDDVFPSGDDAPGAHPNCQCEIELIEIENDDTAKRAVDLDKYRAKARKLVADAKIDRSYHVLEIADRSKDGSRVYIDDHVPRHVSGVDTNVSLAWHELSEWLAMNDGMKYLDAHECVATPLEREFVGEDKWDAYQKEFDKPEWKHEVKEIDDAPPDLDLRVYEGKELELMERLVEEANA